MRLAQAVGCGLPLIGVWLVVTPPARRAGTNASHNLLLVDRGGSTIYHRSYKPPGTRVFAVLGSRFLNKPLRGAITAFGERYVYVVTQSPDASGRTGLSLVRVEKANGAEAGRVWLSGKPAEYEVDPGTGTAYGKPETERSSLHDSPEGGSVRQVALFAALFLSVGWIAPPRGHAQTPSPSRDSLLYAACIPVYVEEFKQKGSDEQRAPLMASMLCQIVAGACQRDLRGESCNKSIRLLSDKLEKSSLSLPYMAASAGRTDLIKKLIEMKVNVNKPVKASGDSALGGGWTPLMIAAAEGHAETVSALLESGADVNATNALGRTALMFASSYGFLAIVNDLLGHRADPNIVPRDSTGWTALIAAAHNGHMEVIRALLDHRADVSIKDKQGQTALAWAEAQGKVELAQALRDSTAKK